MPGSASNSTCLSVITRPLAQLMDQPAFRRGRMAAHCLADESQGPFRDRRNAPASSGGNVSALGVYRHVVAFPQELLFLALSRRDFVGGSLEAGPLYIPAQFPPAAPA